MNTTFAVNASRMPLSSEQAMVYAVRKIIDARQISTMTAVTL